MTSFLGFPSVFQRGNALFVVLTMYMYNIISLNLIFFLSDMVKIFMPLCHWLRASNVKTG